MAMGDIWICVGVVLGGGLVASVFAWGLTEWALKTGGW